ncbi:hypothetical protein [Phaeodactylibacter luteus]|nr:hypothetical protein [Phaeodactylibacter luteus]
MAQNLFYLIFAAQYFCKNKIYVQKRLTPSFLKPTHKQLSLMGLQPIFDC